MSKSITLSYGHSPVHRLSFPKRQTPKPGLAVYPVQLLRFAAQCYLV